MKTSVTPFESPPTRFEASEWNAASRVLRLSPDTAAPPEAPFAGLPPGADEIGIASVPNVPAIAWVAYARLSTETAQANWSMRGRRRMNRGSTLSEARFRPYPRRGMETATSAGHERPVVDAETALRF